MSMNVLVILGTIVVPSVVICFVSVVTFVNLYLNLRRRFPAKVNCWFCNTDTRVPYDQLNAFVCPTCRQYNGFTADGDYNREIPEQYQLRLNNFCYHQPANITDDDKWGNSARSIAATSSSATPRNGLCFGCNRNQELKIHQLASFVPDSEDNYDAEVEEYRKQLEQAYKLCGRCERILKRTLNDVKRNILGSKLAQIGSKSLKVLDMHMRASTKQLALLKRQRWAKLCVYAITGLLLMKLSQDLSETGWTVADLMLLCPPSLLSSITVVVSYVLALKQLIWQQVEKVLAEPAVQHTTERVEFIGNELLQRYAPQLMQCSAPLFETFSEKVPSERSSPFLLNGAIIALGALLASLGSQRMAIKQMLIIALCAADCILKYMQYQDSHYHSTLLLTLTAFALAISCIGQRIIRCDVACGGDMNSSFHKIYSQQCSESDYSDVDTSTNQSPSPSIQHNFPTRISAAHTIRPSNESFIESKLHAVNDAEGNLSRKSLDTTQSGSPSSLSMSPTSSFFMNSYAGNSSKISGSLFNVAAAADPGLDKTRSVFGSERGAPPLGSLLKTPSFSVDDFQAATKLHQGRWNQRKCVTPSIASASGAKQFRYSMSTISQEADAFREDDPLIEDDIDRLSISGRVSINGPLRAGLGTGGSRASLANGNPFAQVKPSRGGVDFDEISSATLRQRRIVRPRAEVPTTTRDSLWPGLLSTAAHMSRTSSQSSGFESQVGTTRRNTPTEGDVLSVYTAPEAAHLAGTEPSKGPPSPVPSSASVFHNQRHGTPYQVRSLFGEQNLFNHALQQKPSPGEGPSGLFFPKYNHFSNGGATTTASPMNRHIFPPQQSKTPSSYHHHSLQQQNHNHLTGIGGGSTLSLHAYPVAMSTTFSAAGLQQDRPPPMAETSFYTSNPPSLNLSKESHGITNGTLPTA
uniref:Ima1 N-terminal domain-containing protein n=1 Tax=Anopheles atroparvus TaxID=41427 RepID=A0A182J7H0_ANOAO